MKQAKYAFSFALVDGYVCPTHGAVQHFLELHSTNKTFTGPNVERVAVCAIPDCDQVQAAPIAAKEVAA